MAAQAAQSIAMGMVLLIVPWLILGQGGSAGLAALAFGAGVLPYVLLAIPVGVLADRSSRRRLVLGIELAVAAVTAGMAVWVALGEVPALALLTLAFVVGVGRVMVEGALFAAVPAICPRSGLVAAQATVSTALIIGLSVGPAVAGALIAGLGAAWALALTAPLLLAGAAAALGLSPAVDSTRSREHTARRAALRGLGTVWRDPAVRTLMLSGLLWGVAIAGSGSLLVPLLKVDLGLSALQVAGVTAAGSLATLAATPIVRRLDRRWADVRVFPVLVLVFGGAVLGLGLSTSVPAAALSYGALVLIQTAGVATLVGARSRRTPSQMQGLVGVTGRMFINIGGTVGSLVAGGLVVGLGLRGAYAVLALWALGVAVLVWALLRRVERDPPAVPGVASAA